MNRFGNVLVSSQEAPGRGYAYVNNGLPTGYFNRASTYKRGIFEVLEKRLTTALDITCTVDTTKISYADYAVTFCSDRAYSIQNLYTPRLQEIYNIIDEEELESFFIQNINNSKLIQPLQEINNKLKEFFSKEEFFIDVDYNSVTDDEKELVITINTRLDPEKAVEKLDLFFDWYVKNISNEVRSKLTIALD